MQPGVLGHLVVVPSLESSGLLVPFDSSNAPAGEEENSPHLWCIIYNRSIRRTSTSASVTNNAQPALEKKGEKEKKTKEA